MDATLPDAALPDAALPDATLPDSALPDSALPDSALPDSALPDSGSPAAIPTLTPAAIKTFDLTWADVADATSYAVVEDSDGALGPAVPSVLTTGIAPGVEGFRHVVPLYARLDATYVLRSCDAAGCTDAAPVTARGSLTDAIGYLKATNTDIDDWFGSSVSLSADGRTLAIGAEREDGGSRGVGGDESDNAASNAGAVYVFARDGAGNWIQQAYLKADNSSANAKFGWSVALSADGSALAVGAIGDGGSGAVYMFVREAVGGWTQRAYLKAGNGEAGDLFGSSVSMSADGGTLAVGASDEDSAGPASDNSAREAGAVYVFVRGVADAWSQRAYLKASGAGAGDGFGISVSLSADGNSLAVGAPLEDSNATGDGGDQTNNSASDAGAAYVFVRAGAGTWSQQAYLKASNTDANDLFGVSVSMTADGATLVVGAQREDGAGTGVVADDTDNSALDAGAVYVFERHPTGWSQQAYVKASNTDADDAFGSSVTVSADGATLAVGAWREAGGSVGFRGDETDDSSSAAGAAYVFVRDGTSGWVQQAYMKASNTGTSDTFGSSVSLSADGNTLAVGAPQEDGSGTGVSPASDDLANGAGAVYLY